MWVTKDNIEILVREEIIHATKDHSKITPRIVEDIIEQFLGILPFKYEPYSEDDILFGLYPNQIEQAKIYDISGLKLEEVTKLVKQSLDGALAAAH